MKQFTFIKFSIRKNTFLFLFFIVALILVSMPLFMTFNDLLTRLVMRMDAYKIIRNYVVPWEIRMVGVLLSPFGFQPHVVGEYLAIGRKEPLLIEIAWNCIGWQSLLFFLLTGWVGFQGDHYTNWSKIKAWMIGFLGTFLVNLLRITLVVILAYYFGQNVAILFHDYGSILAVILWLFFFWWFVYKYVLEEKSSYSEKEAGKV